jgi:hypothetical protein
VCFYNLNYSQGGVIIIFPVSQQRAPAFFQTREARIKSRQKPLSPVPPLSAKRPIIIPNLLNLPSEINTLSASAWARERNLALVLLFHKGDEILLPTFSSFQSLKWQQMCYF